MAKKASVKELLQALAKERGVEITDIEKAPSGSGREGGTTLKQRLESGAGFGEAFTETAKEKYKTAKEAITTTKGIKSLGKKVYGEMFKGDDIFSAYMRGRLKKGGGKEGKDAEKSVGGLGGDSSAHLAVIAKQSMAIQGMARDTNVLRQNLQQLVKIWGGTPATKKEAQKERKEDVNYFAEQDKREAEQEAARTKTPTAIAGGESGGEKKEGGGFLDSFMSFFSSGFMGAIKTFFSPKMLMKVFSKVFLPLTIIATLFSGIMDGFKRYQETGSLTEAVTAGLGGMLKFLTFGVFGEDTIKKLFDSISNFFDKPLETITGIFKGIKDFFVGLFGGEVKVEDKTPASAAKVTPEAPKGPATPDQMAGQMAGGPTAPPPLAEGPSKPTPAPAAPSTAPTPDGGESKRKESAKKFQEAEQARADVEALQMAEADLQGLYRDWRSEKGAAMERLVNKGVDFSDDPKSPNYPAELKAIDDKYNKWIGIKKSEIESYKKKPGVKEELKRQKAEEADFDSLEKEAKTPSKVAGTKFTTTETVTTGGGETTRSLAKTPEAKKAEEDLKALEQKQAEERKAAVAKAKSEGKITGRFATSKDFEEVGELKALKTKQEAERAELIKKISEGTSVQTTTSGGGGGGVSAGGGGAPAASAAGGGGGALSGGGGGGGGAPSGGGEISAAGGGAASAPSVSPTPEAAPAAGPSMPSGAALSASSTEVAEGQRMESSADQGSVVNAPTTNNSKQTSDQKTKVADVYDSDLAKRLAYS